MPLSRQIIGIYQDRLQADLDAENWSLSCHEAGDVGHRKLEFTAVRI